MNAKIEGDSVGIKVSVTVPVYNTERYLDKCLRSLVSQTLLEIEVILVDDGSSDGSPAICEGWAARDPRVRVIHKPNGGVASARQAGLDVSRGEYVTVCDSDDWTEPDMYEKLYKAAKSADADIAKCCYLAEYDDGTSVEKENLFKHPDDCDLLTDEILRTNPMLPTWSHIFRRTLFATVSYEPGIDLGEDYLIFLKLLLLRPSIVQIHDCLYHYRRSYSSQSYTNSSKMRYMYMSDRVGEWMKQNFDAVKYKDVFYRRIIERVFNCLRTVDLDRGYWDKLIHRELKWKDFFGNKISLKTVVAYFCKILPFSWVKYMFDKSSKLRYK